MKTHTGKESPFALPSCGFPRQKLIIGTALIGWFLALCCEAQAQNLIWAKRAGGSGSDQGHASAVDSAGNSYAAGIFFSSATFGLGEANQTTLSPSGSFIAKYSPRGTLQWAKRLGGIVQSMVADSANNLYVTGNFGGTETYGAGDPNQTSLTSAGGADIFVAKYNSSGVIQWAKRAGQTPF